MKYFIRVFYDGTYLTFVIKDKIYLKDILDLESTIYFECVDNKVVSNVNSDIEVNRLYSIKEQGVIFKIGVVSNIRKIAIVSSNLKCIFGDYFDVEIDLVSNIVSFSNELYIGYKKHYGGTFYFNSQFTMCVNGVEFVVDNNTVILSELFPVVEGCYIYIDVTLENSSDDVETDFKYSIVFKEKLNEFDEVIWKYLATPLITIISMGTISIIMKRQSMMYFMVISSIATSISSCLMYFHKKRGISYRNEAIKYSFSKLLGNFLSTIKNDLELYYRKQNYRLVDLNSSVGYVMDGSVDVDVNIAEDSFKETLNSIDLSYAVLMPINFGDFKLGVSGKTSEMYVINFICQGIMSRRIRKVVVIGEFSKVGFLRKVVNVSSQIDDSEGVLHLVVDYELYNKLNIDVNCVIYLNCNLECNFLIISNSKNSHSIKKWEGKKCNKKLFLKLTLNLTVLELMIRKSWTLINKNITNTDGIMIGDNLYIDFDRDGPHGLIVGMTGSGKSILLQTIITSICSKYSVEEAVIGIIDFKGEALINMVRELPHICATYSNLNNDYEYVIMAIENELVYRQKELKKHCVSEYAHNTTLFPRLFLFIDEFAEVKFSSDKLIKKIISIARVGRSLGIYLVLSLQKSSGTVDEQLRSNINFKICLRVNSKQDSRDVIECDDAYYLTNPGDAIVKCGHTKNRIRVFNYNDSVLDDIVINGMNTGTSTHYQAVVNNIEDEKSKYVIWKSFPDSGYNGAIINDPRLKNFVEMTCNYDNYIIIGETCEERLDFVKTIIGKNDYIVFYAGQEKGLFDIEFSEFTYLPFYFNCMKYLNQPVYFVVDNVDIASNELLVKIINDLCLNYYRNIKVILCDSSVNVAIGRHVKNVGNKYLFRCSDNSEIYNLFFTRTEVVISSENVGLCKYNNLLVLFKNYKESFYEKKTDLLKFDEYIYLSNLESVSFEGSLIIYDKVIPNIGGNFISTTSEFKTQSMPMLIHYSLLKRSDERLLTMFKSVVVTTDKYEYNYRRCKIMHGMMYDLVRNDDIIIFSKLNIWLV